MALPEGHTILGCQFCGTPICEIFDKEPGSIADKALTQEQRIEMLAEQLHENLALLIPPRLQEEAYNAILAWLRTAEGLFPEGGRP